MIVVDIRFCTPDDMGRIVEVDRTSPYPWPERVILGDFLDGKRGLSYFGAFAPETSVSTAKNRLLGYAVLGDEKGYGLLMNLVVIPNYRRRGIGSQLLLAAAECATAMNFPRLDLRVRCTNAPAVALYRAFGFRGDGTKQGFYSNGDAALCMSLKLPLTLGEEPG